MAKVNRTATLGHLSDCQAGSERMSEAHLLRLFNSVPREEIDLNINKLPDKQSREIVRQIVESFTPA